MYYVKALARRSEKQFPLLPGFFYIRERSERERTMQKLCECGCGLPTPIAKRTKSGRNQRKGEPLRFINGHNSRLLSGEEQRRRSSFREPSLFRFSGSKNNYVKFHQRHMHRVVAEQKLGRPLERGEIVHHLDGDKWNNAPENLEVMTQAEHARLHSIEYWKTRKENRADDL